jgi:hypothetical protein
MAALEWKHTELKASDPGNGDAVAQLFDGRKQMRTEIFVREDLQNRVDARRDDFEGPVRVTIAFKTLPSKLIRKYFPIEFQEFYLRSETQSLKPEDKDRRTEEINNLFLSDEFPVLVIEDFYTTGLNGPINSLMPVKDSKSPLYHPTNALTCFFRRNGESGKSNKKLGSAGLGRHVYYKASRISSKLIYTVPTDLSRESDERLISLSPRALFFGQSFQRELAERIDGKQRRFCSYHHLSGTFEDEFPMPFGIDDAEASDVDQVRRDFRLERLSVEAGTSIIIPFPVNSLTAESLTNSIVRDFPMPILAGMLKVEIDRTLIDSKSIVGLSESPEVNEHNKFLKDALKAQPDAKVQVDIERLKKPFDEDLFDKAVLADLAREFNDNAPVCVEAQIRFGPRANQFGAVKIVVQKTTRGVKGRWLVARSGLVLSKYSDRFTSNSNAMVLVQIDELGTLLREVENPAHTEWVPGDIQAHKCACADELIRFVTTAHKALTRILTNLDTEDDSSIFSDLVPKGRRPSKPSKKSPFVFELRDNGQSLLMHPAPPYDAEPGTVWRLAVVYDSVQGSGRARKGYRPGTFDLETAPLNLRGGEVRKRGACHLDVVVSEPDRFELQMGPCGFADWADIRIAAAELGVSAGGDS